ncbi:hypothetical protein D1007_53780 [Hordeum vulgare]|nr:hypothetical protein D1007_53780 [Hordeum vulgare]
MRKGLFQKIRGRRAIVRTSLYADDAVMFKAPIKRDIDDLAAILKGFGWVMGLCTNFQKRSVVPIRCSRVRLGHVLQSVPATRTSFLMRYLSLPLLIWQLKNMDIQFLEDKVASKLATWEGQNITTIGRATLVRYMTTSHVIYFITPRVVPSGTLYNVKKLERAFPWCGSYKTIGAKCKVNWEVVFRSI